ncbi:hypothetical protein PV325_010035, partial [Microctonus aethiopoides]
DINFDSGLVNNITTFQKASVSARVLIGDEDSSTISNVRKSRSEIIFKLADNNHLNKHFVTELYAVAQNKGNSIQLADALRQIPDHAFGNHDNCNAKLYNKLQQIFLTYANNAAKFSIAASSQANESVNNIMAHNAPKNRKHTGLYAARRDREGFYRAEKAILPKSKTRRNILQEKENLRKKKESIEGINYKCNCGFDIELEKMNFALNK